jgi:hypothetical protein
MLLFCNCIRPIEHNTENHEVLDVLGVVREEVLNGCVAFLEAELAISYIDYER